MKVPSLRRHRSLVVLAALLLSGPILFAPVHAASAMARAASVPKSSARMPSSCPRSHLPRPEWPSPNRDLCNTRVAASVISSANVSTLRTAWTLPLTGEGYTGFDVANPVIADGVAFLQDGASNVTAVRYTTGQILWTHQYNSPDYGPNGVTFNGGRIYGVTATGVFALDARTGQQLWYNTQLSATRVNFDIAPQVANGKVFVASALTAGGGMVYALDAQTGAFIWSFQTVIDNTGQQLTATAGGAWDPVLIGPDHSIYVGTGNPYLSEQEAVTAPSRELYTDSILKLDQDTGRLDWYYQAFPDDFHDWDLQISPIYTFAGDRPVVVAAGKGGYVFAFDPRSGALLWKTPVGIHNGHDNDDQLALEGTLDLRFPYTLEPGEAGGVETNMAAADGVVYVPVDNLPETFQSATQQTGTSDFTQGTGEMVAISLATGRPLWTTNLPQLPLGGATVSDDLVFTTTFTGELLALSRRSGAIVWTAQLPAGSNAPLAVAGNTLLAGAGVPLSATQHAAVVAYQVPGIIGRR
jgi:outer membrane protein assembly factor BamB